LAKAKSAGKCCHSCPGADSSSNSGRGSSYNRNNKIDDITREKEPKSHEQAARDGTG
jgi:hypothetical protein